MQSERLTGLFVNCVEAQDSIYASGKMAYDCLVSSEKYKLDYIEITKDITTLPTSYDFYFFNYHFFTMSWLDAKSIKELLPGVKITMVLEVSPNDPFVLCSPEDFDIYCVLDPTLNIDMDNVFAFPRPLEKFGKVPQYEPRDVPLIGSFGLGTLGKGFEHVIDAVNKEFDKAQVRINIPFAAYWDKGESYAKQLAEMCKQKAKEGIEVTVTHDYMSKPALIEWCSQNTVNCFLYDRNIPGLAATTDQAIASGRPLVISKNNTFRHIQKFIKPFPYQSLKEAIETTPGAVSKIQQEWSPEKFREQFEYVLEKSCVDKLEANNSGFVTLRTKSPTFADRVQALRDKAAIRTRLKKLAKNIGLADLFKRKPKPPESRTQFGEDLIVYELLIALSVQNVRYLEIGLKDYLQASNTYLFYENGCNGILVESDADLCEQLKMARPRDMVLNIAGEISINNLISNYFTECPDFVLINTEENASKLFETMDFDLYNPAVFCVSRSDDREKEDAFFEAKGYFAFHETTANTIFVNRNLYDFYEYQKAHRLEDFDSH